MRRKPFALLLLAALLLSGCAGTQNADRYALTLWYAEGDPLAPVLSARCESYNENRARGSLAVEMRAFETEEKLLAALQGGAAPALALLGHEAAFSLYQAGLLFDPGLSPAYSDWLTARDGCIGHGYYPLGCSLPLLRCRGAAALPVPSLLSEAAAREKPCLYIGDYAALFAQQALDAGLVFVPDWAQRMQDEYYVNLYNAIALAALSGGLSLDEPGVRYRIDDSAALRAEGSEGAAYCPLSADTPWARCRGLAVTAREARMRKALPTLLSRLFGDETLSPAVLAAGLVPALPCEFTASDALDEALLALRGRALRLPDGDLHTAREESDFSQTLRAALSLLR